MNEQYGKIWLEEYAGNPSVVALCFADGSDTEMSIGLTKQGVEATIGLLQEWLEYHDGRMEELFSELTEWGAEDD